MSLCLSDVISAILSLSLTYGIIDGHIIGNYKGVLIYYVRKSACKLHLNLMCTQLHSYILLSRPCWRRHLFITLLLRSCA